MQKRNLFIDVDDVVLNSSKAAINIFNKKFNLNPEKSFEDISGWSYKSICEDITKKDIVEAFESDEFWDSVTINEYFKNLINNKVIEKYCKICFSTRGTEKNLEKKRIMLTKFMEDNALKNLEWEFIGIDTKIYSEDHGKKHVNMKYGIQIDDNINYLNTNADVKILVTNGIETDYNCYNHEEAINKENLYIVSSLKEAEEIITFFIANDF